MNTLVRPDYIFRLKCDFRKRIDRIEKRTAADKNDDITVERDRRYSLILDHLQERIGIITEITTDDISPDNVVGKILNCIGEVI